MPAPSQQLQVYPLPPPVGGINARDSLFSMPETDAIDIVNFVPEPYGMRLKTGSQGNHGPFSTSSGKIGTIGGSVNGASQGFHITDDGIYEIDNFATENDITGTTTITDKYWQFARMGSSILMVNGTDQPIGWTGSGNVTATAWTGSGLTLANLSNITNFRGRLYFLHGGGEYYYTDTVGAVTGALSLIDIADFMELGEELLSLDSFSLTTGFINEEILCFISETGEILCYSGSYPGSVDWRLVARFIVAPPISKRCAFKVDGDLYIITRSGLISMRGLFSGGDGDLSKKVNKLWKKYTGDYSTNDDWCGVHYPNRDYVLINVPVSSTESIQLGFYKPTGAWFRFTGWNASHFRYSSSGGVLVFATEYSGSSYLRLGDVPDAPRGEIGTTTIVASITQAHSGLGDRRLIKSISQASAFIEVDTTDSNPSLTLPFDQTISMGVATDYNLTAQTQTPSFPVTSSTFATQQLFDVVGEGKVASLFFGGTFARFAMSYNGAEIYYTKGGVS